MVEPHSSNFRLITTNFLSVRIFRKFTVLTDALTDADKLRYCGDCLLERRRSKVLRSPIVIPTAREMPKKRETAFSVHQST